MVDADVVGMQPAARGPGLRCTVLGEVALVVAVAVVLRRVGMPHSEDEGFDPWLRLRDMVIACPSAKLSVCSTGNTKAPLLRLAVTEIVAHWSAPDPAPGEGAEGEQNAIYNERYSSMSNAVDDILSSLDMAQLAKTWWVADQSEVRAGSPPPPALPALFGGLDANAQDPSGAGSILEALGQHDPSLLDGGVDLGQIDAQDGAAITSHIFGSNEEEVYNQLGGYSAAGGLGGSLFKRLLPILAPIVLSYVMKQMTQRSGGSTSGSSGGGGLGDILGQ